MRELLAAKPKSCAYVRWPVRHEWDEERLAEFTRIAKLNGCPDAVFSTRRPVTDDRHIPAELAEWLKSLPHPTAVLASADPMGAHVINACSAHGSIAGSLAISFAPRAVWEATRRPRQLMDEPRTCSSTLSIRRIANV